MHAIARILILALWICASLGVCSSGAHASDTLKVCATVPELGSIIKHIGGGDVSVTVFAKPAENPHFVEAKPSFIRKLHEADLFCIVGLELEIGWVPVLIQQSRNGDIRPGAKGYLDTSNLIRPLEVPTVAVDRSMGDVHPTGNPHFLLDPLGALRVAEAIQKKMVMLRPSLKKGVEERYAAFRKKMGVSMVGEKLAGKYDFTKLARLHQHGKLGDFLKSQQEDGLLGGWLGGMLPYYGAKVVADHNLWPYFARTFGLRVAAHLEPLPGISPTTKHLAKVVKQMKAENVKVLMSCAYYDPKTANKVAKLTGARVALMANQAGARPGTDDFFGMVDYNVKALAAAFGGK